MLDPKFLRENIDLVRKGVARKKFQVDLDAVLAADEARRHAVAEFEVARSAQNAANKEMAAMPKGSPEFQAKVAEMKALLEKLIADGRSTPGAAQKNDVEVVRYPKAGAPKGKAAKKAK